jgi:hypothetical protein
MPKSNCSYDYIYIAASIPVVTVQVTYRILVSITLNFIFISRVDRTVFASGLEPADPACVNLDPVCACV